VVWICPTRGERRGVGGEWEGRRNRREGVRSYLVEEKQQYGFDSDSPHLDILCVCEYAKHNDDDDGRNEDKVNKTRIMKEQ
jgi:hypothetical protein